MFRRILPLVLLPVLFACRDDGPTAISAPENSLAAISDGTTAGGNPEFFFYTPVVSTQPTIPSNSDFNASLLPEVAICANYTGTSVCPSGALVYKTTTGAITVSSSLELYQLNWKTDVAAGNYRAFVRLGDLVFGYFDVKVQAKSPGSAKSPGVVVVQRGNTLPIKFYLGAGAVTWELQQLGIDVPSCTGNPDCVTVSVQKSTNDTTEVVTPLQDAAAALPPGWFASYPYQVVTVIIAQQVSPCLPTGADKPYADQAGACYEFVTYPQLDNGFDKQVRVEVCLDPSADMEQFDMWKFSSFGPEAGLRKPQAVAEQLISCPTSSQLAALSKYPVLRAAATGLQTIARWLGPAPLYARDTGMGGLVGSFSDIGWAQTRHLTIASGDGQTAAPGGLLANPVRVRVVTGHHDDDLQPQPNVSVTFAVNAGGGALSNETSTATLITDAAGYTEIGWLLGRTGPQELIATTAWGDTVTFAATVSSSGPASEWLLDGNLLDNAGTNNGTLSGTSATYDDGLSGQALRFFGPNSPATMTAAGAGINDANQITLSTWVKLTGSGDGNTVQRFVTLGNEKAVIRFDGYFRNGGPQTGIANTLDFYVHTNGAAAPAEAHAYADGVLASRGCYYHVVGTYDGANLRLFLNGALQTTVPHTGTLVAGSGVMLSNTPSFEMLDGVLDEVKIYSRALDASEVQSVFNQHGTSFAVCGNQNQIG